MGFGRGQPEVEKNPHDWLQYLAKPLLHLRPNIFA
jgi:hypothetical protein